MESTSNLGATGRYPDGKLNEHDEGELRIAVGEHKGNVFLDFGKPITWLGMPPAQMRGLIEKLTAVCNRMQRKRGG